MLANSSGKFQVNVWFQVKVRFNLSNGRQKGQAQSIHIYGIVSNDAVDLVLSSKITNTLAFRFEAESFVKENT